MSHVFRCDHCSREFSREMGGWEARGYSGKEQEPFQLHSCPNTECFFPMLRVLLDNKGGLFGFRLELFMGERK